MNGRAVSRTAGQSDYRSRQTARFAVALDPDTSTERWRLDGGDSSLAAEIAIADGVAYVALEDSDGLVLFPSAGVHALGGA